MYLCVHRNSFTDFCAIALENNSIEKDIVTVFGETQNDCLNHI